MKPQNFDRLAHAAADFGSRRDFLHGLAGIALGVGILRHGDSAVAKKKRKRKKRKEEKAKPNEFGCIEFGDPCQSADDCCSGICEGEKGKRRCKGHDSGGCMAGSTTVGCGGAYVACTTELGERGACVTTTGNAGYCGGALMDYPCQTDVDCQVIGGGLLGPRAACIRCDDAIGGSLCAAVAGTPG
jgi:hypothetical protein